MLHSVFGHAVQLAVQIKGSAAFTANSQPVLGTTASLIPPGDWFPPPTTIARNPQFWFYVQRFANWVPRLGGFIPRIQISLAISIPSLHPKSQVLNCKAFSHSKSCRSAGFLIPIADSSAIVAQVERMNVPESKKLLLPSPYPFGSRRIGSKLLGASVLRVTEKFLSSQGSCR